MKRIFLAAICTLTALSAYGQAQTAPPAIAPCTLNIAKAPAVRGVKLGMKIDEVLAMFPGSAEEVGVKASFDKADGYPKFGTVGISISPSQYSTKDRFAGISGFNFWFLDGRIAQYEVQYQLPPVGPKWNRVDDFIAKMAEAFQLPPVASWAGDQNDASRKSLKCDGFQLQASNLNFRGSLTVATVDTPYKIRQQRQTEFEEKIRREFKP